MGEDALGFEHAPASVGCSRPSRSESDDVGHTFREHPRRSLQSPIKTPNCKYVD